MRLANQELVRNLAPPQPTRQLRPDLGAYRAAAAELAREVGGPRPDSAHATERTLTARLAEPELAAVLSRTSDGLAGTVQRLLQEIRDYRPHLRSSAGDLTALIRIYLCSQIDVLWWGRTPAYVTDADVTTSTELVDLDPLRRRGQLGFVYRRQADRLVTRAVRAAERRIWPGRTPHTAGLRFTRTRPEAVALLNQLSAQFATTSRPGTPPLWVTSLARSTEHQHHLRALGYAAMLPSAHCVGYAMDLELAWLRRFGAQQALTASLLERQGAGDVNVIDEGQVWHVCISPAAAGGLRRDFHAKIGS